MGGKKNPTNLQNSVLPYKLDHNIREAIQNLNTWGSTLEIVKKSPDTIKKWSFYINLLSPHIKLCPT